MRKIAISVIRENKYFEKVEYIILKIGKIKVKVVEIFIYSGLGEQ